jgi:DNA-binding response OmpR family regulator
VSELFLLTNATESAGDILPALGLLLHTVRTAPAEVAALADTPVADAVLIDARRDLAHARQLCRLLRTVGQDVPVLAIMTEGGLAAVTAEWGADDVVLHTAGPAEVEARLRLAMGRQASLATPATPDEIRSGDLSIDEATYTARLRARVLDLTFKEFELLKFLAQHPGRVFTRAHLLQEVWGYDYFGGTRTVDVHVRRLRAKLGPEHEALIGTVRNVGYRFVPLKGDDGRRPGLREVTGDSAAADSAQPANGGAMGAEQRMESGNGTSPAAGAGRAAGPAGASKGAGTTGASKEAGPTGASKEAGPTGASKGAGPARASL